MTNSIQLIIYHSDNQYSTYAVQLISLDLSIPLNALLKWFECFICNFFK